MAAADYKLCDVCNGKSFYDANVDYEEPEPPKYEWLPRGVGDWAVLCETCAETHVAVIMAKSDLPALSQHASDE